MSESIIDTTGRPCNLVESFGTNVSISEDVEGHNLDPDIYVAVVEAELGVGGIVNKNDRIYQVPEFIAENRKLQARIDEGEFVDAELGHPRPGGVFGEPAGPGFNIPARLLYVGVKAVEGHSADGPVRAVGKFGLLNTSHGRDVLALFKADMPIGVSSRGEGVLSEYLIEEGGPYSAANPDSVGSSVGLVSDFHLERYDLVRVPSAGTYFQQGGPSGDATESLEEPTMAAENTSQADAATRRPDTIIDIHGLVAALRSEPSSDVSEAVERLEVQGKVLSEQADADRERHTVNESTIAELTQQVTSLKEARDSRALRDRLDAAATSATNEKRFGVIVSEQLVRRIDEGSLVTTEAVETSARDYFAMCASVNTPVITPVEAPPADAADDSTVIEEQAPSSHSLPEHLIQSMRVLDATPGA